jgi:hypothetical protein
MQDQVMECSVTRARVFFPGGPPLFSFRDVGSTRGEFPDCRGFSERGLQMALIEESIEINAPAEKVFALTTDAAQWSRWHSAIPEAEQTSDGPVGVGTTFKGITRLMGQSIPWTATATEYEANRKFGKNIDSGSVFIKQHNTYTSKPSGTTFTMTYDMKCSGCMWILSPLLVSAMRKEMKKSLVNVKQIVER